MVSPSSGMRAMVHGRTTRILPVLGLMLEALTLSGCAQERSITSEPSGYTLYVSTNTYSVSGERLARLYFLDADSLAIFDSMPLLLTAGAASADGRSLFVSAENYEHPEAPDTTFKLDLRTRERLWSTAVGTDIYVAGNGSVLFSPTRPPECATLMLSAETGATIRRIDGACMVGEVATTSDVIPVAVANGEERVIHMISVQSGDVLRSVELKDPWGSPFLFTQLALRPGGGQLLAMGACSSAECVFAFGVFDAYSGMPLLFSTLASITGDIEIGSDGLYAVVSNPVGIDGTGLQFIDVFNLETVARVRRFDVTSGLHPDGFGQVRFLPGDRKAVIAPHMGGPLQILDLNAMSVGPPIWIPPDVHPYPEVWVIFLGPTP